ncbi:MAG: co-chaperone DjlA [Gammaproteobacteria bacterium]|nr:co-chaperone DjlA [Gammaproteobacteria bacterium]
MNWWGKLLGGAFGYMLGGYLGALIGAALGHRFDKGIANMGISMNPAERERVQTAFFTATFSVLGHIAKADGQVTREEIRIAEAVMEQMQLNDEQKSVAKRLFNEGKEPDFDLDGVLDQFVGVCHRRHTLLRIFLEVLVQAAMADGHLSDAEEVVLQRVSSHIGFTPEELAHLESMVAASARWAGGGAGPGAGRGPTRAQDLASAYALLDVPESASDAEVKRAYRRLMSQHHPDKLVAKGLPEEMMKIAAQKTHEIRQAYERIKEARGF